MAGTFFILAISFFACEAKTSSIAPKHSFPRVAILHEEADRVDYDDKGKVLRLYGHVKLSQGETRLYADTVTYHLQSDEVEGEGNLKFIRKQDTLTGEHLHLYYRQKRLVAEGNPVHAFFSESVSSHTLPVTVSGRMLEYRWEEQFLKGNGNAALEKQGLKASADQLIYKGKAEELDLDGHVHLERFSKGSLWCDHLVYFLKTDQAEALGHVQGQFVVTEKP